MDDVAKAVQILKDGGIVIFPTDTAFGIGCRIDNEVAVKRLFTIRKRPETKAVPVLVSSISMAQEYLQPISQEVVEVMKKYWPGALTIVLQSKREKIPELVRGGGETVGVRMPDHQTTLALITGVGAPLVGTSANFSGEPTPYQFDALDKELVKLVDFVVPGECDTKLASTVIDYTKKPWKVLRQGAVSVNV